MTTQAAITKKPSEQITMAIDYTGRLPVGAASISSGTASALKLSDRTSATATVLSSASTTTSGSQSRFTLRAGDSGQDYLITISTTFDNGNVLVEDFILQVRA